MDTVEAPISDRRNRHAIGERPPSVLLQCLQRHEAAVAPAPDGDAVGIDVFLRGPDLGRLDLVAGFVVADMASDDAARFPADEAGSPAVDGDNNVAEARGDVGLEIDGEFLVYGLRAGATVEIEEDGVFGGYVKMWWSAFDDLELEAIDGDGLVGFDG